jgi:poly(A) polymerase
MEIINNIIKKFNKAGFDIYEVGGHVRDSYIGKESHDIDMTTNAKPDVIKSLLDGFGSIYLVGEKFGTVGVINNGTTVEVTTYRKEVYPNGSRKPTVEFGDNLIEDLSRRDFTFNAIARDSITGKIVDPFNGIDDINHKIIKCVGNDDDRFNEDPLRMLRAIRFACQLDFSLHVKINHPERLKIVSKERIRDEVTKILLSDKAAYGIRKLCQFGLMEYIVPEFMSLRFLKGGKNHIKDAFDHSLLVLYKGTNIDYGSDNLVFRLACWLHDIGKPDTMMEDDDGVHFYSHHTVGAIKARKILRRLRYDNEIVESVCHLIKYHMTPIVLQKELVGGNIKKKIIMRLIRNVGDGNINMLLDLVKCDIRSSANPRYKFMSVLTTIVEECRKEKPEELDSPIDGLEIMTEFSLTPSPLIGEIKNYLTGLVIDGIIGKEDKETAKVKAREYIGERNGRNFNSI